MEHLSISIADPDPYFGKKGRKRTQSEHPDTKFRYNFIRSGSDQGFFSKIESGFGFFQGLDPGQLHCNPAMIKQSVITKSLDIPCSLYTYCVSGTRTHLRTIPRIPGIPGYSRTQKKSAKIQIRH